MEQSFRKNIGRFILGNVLFDPKLVQSRAGIPTTQAKE